MSHRPRARWRSYTAAALVALTAAGTSLLPANADDEASVVGRTNEDDFGTVHIEYWRDGKPADRATTRLGETYRDDSRNPDKDDSLKERPLSRTHPLIDEWFATLSPDETVSVVVSTHETLTIPRFPEPDGTKDRSDALNQRYLKLSEEIVRRLGSRRAEANRELNAVIESVGGKLTEQFWLVPAVAAQMPLSSVQRLLESSMVTYVEPVQTNDYPPADGNAANDVDDARARIQSDPYFNQNLTNGWIGLLDSGVRASHTLLSGRIALQGDCVNGGATCFGSGANPADDCWNHGTSSAGVLSGNNNQGNPQRGVTGIQVDSWKVYPSTTDAQGNCTGSLNTTAVVRGFQEAVKWLDRVIVAEMQGSGNESSTVSTAADAAFDAGSVVIAANGNNGPNASTVNTPANAHRVIGVGGFDTQSGTQYGNQSRGPTADNRIKPDIQTPTNSETASTGCAFGVPCSPMSNTANRVYGGTSGATPYGGAAAALARNWMLRFGQIDPGHVYARLILSGENTWPFDNTEGAGPIRLPVNGMSWWGKVSVANHQVIEIPLSVANGQHDLAGALWWPESGSTHNDVDVSLVDPFGNVVDTSISIPSVFERAQANGNLTAGTWKLRIRGYSVTGNQTVYYGATVRN